nr:hypothetical protein HMPREF0276_1789 [Corynebacterium accolens ATCC 49725]
MVTMWVLVGWGSSPLTRGAQGDTQQAELAEGLIPAHAGSTQTFIIPLLVQQRLIPAHAGSTPSCHLHRARRGAHPRSRGEHIRSGSVLTRRGGSSPLTRGALPIG